MTYTVQLLRVEPRAIASVNVQMPIRDVPTRFRESLDQVYTAAKLHAIPLDGQNIFVYRPGSVPLHDVEFGVGVRTPFADVGRVHYSETPSGEAATTTSWGDYSRLGAAHAAVLEWCRANGRTPTGVRWEVYGHWSDDPAQRRVDVFHQVER